MTSRDRELLKKCFLFSDGALPPDLAVEIRQFSTGQLVYGPESQQRCLGILLEGRAIAHKDETDAVLNIFAPGDVFGAAALFGSDAAYASRIVAKGKCRVAFLTEAAVTELLQTNPKAALSYIRYLSDKIRFLNEKVLIFTSTSCESRLASYLLIRQDGGRVHQQLSGGKLASLLAVSRASLYRAAEQLESAGAIRREGKEWIITDEQALLRFRAGGGETPQK